MLRSVASSGRIPEAKRPDEDSPVRWRHLGGLVLLILLSSCHSLPVEDWTHLKDVRVRLLSAQADRFTPSRYTEFEQHFTDIRQTFAQLEGRLPVFRSGRRIEALDDDIRALNRTGEALVSAAERARGKKLERLRLEMALLENLLSNNRPRPFLTDSREPMRTIRVQLARLKLLIEQGDDRSAEAVLNVLKTSSLEVKKRLAELERRFSDPRLLRIWSRLCRKALECSRGTGEPVLLIDKYRRRALLLRDGAAVRRFTVDLGWNGFNDKWSQGDGATPEGEYTITKKKEGEHTRFHRALLLSYPNDEDMARFEQAVDQGELPRDAHVGSMIEIHGAGGLGQDWTDGCIALSNREIDLLYRDAYVGMPVFIVGKCQSLK